MTRWTVRPARLIRSAGLAATLMAITAGCSGPGEIRFNQDGCTIDGRRADLAHVEAREAAVQHRIASLRTSSARISVPVPTGFLSRGSGPPIA